MLEILKQIKYVRKVLCTQSYLKDSKFNDK